MKRSLFVCLLCILLSGCLPSGSVALLLQYPETFLHTITTAEGEIKEVSEPANMTIEVKVKTSKSCKVGRVGMICNEVEYEQQQIEVISFKLFDGESYITVYQKIGGSFLPVPLSQDGTYSAPNGKILVTGLWTKNGDGEYVLYVDGTEPLHPTPTPTTQ